jgi:hypothetical protein
MQSKHHRDTAVAPSLAAWTSSSWHKAWINGQTASKLTQNHDVAGRVAKMAEYQGYEIIKNPVTGKWEVFWKGKKVEGEFVREAEAEEWIDDQFPSHRF